MLKYGDFINTEIIRLLDLDGRASNKSIAKALGVSETTIANRIRTLYAENAVRVVLKQYAHEYSSSSVAAKVEFYVEELDKIDEVIKVIDEVDEIFSAYLTNQRPEIIADVRAESLKALNILLLKLSKKMPYIRQIDTLPVLTLGDLSTTMGLLKLSPQQGKLPEDKDEALIALLQQDGRHSISYLAKQLGLSITATRYRFNKLLKQPGYEIGLVCDSAALGYTVWFDLRVTIAPAYIPDALEKFSKHEGIRVAAHIAGSFNLALFLVTKTVKEVDDFVKEEIRPLAGLVDFTLMRVPRVLKYDYHYNL